MVERFWRVGGGGEVGGCKKRPLGVQGVGFVGVGYFMV